MRIEGQRRSDNFEDRGSGRGGGGGGVPVQALFGLLQLLGFKGAVILAGVAAVAFLFMNGRRAVCAAGRVAVLNSLPVGR